MADKKSDILDLSTTGEITRKNIIIDDKPYEIVDSLELSLTQQQRLLYTASFLAGYLIKEANPADDKKALRLMEAAIDLIVVDLPAALKDKLKDQQKFQIIHAFGDANKKKKNDPDAE